MGAACTIIVTRMQRHFPRRIHRERIRDFLTRSPMICSQGQAKREPSLRAFENGYL
jgi:hypothetical protein